MRRPSMTARIERQRQTVEITCFLRVTLLDLTDMALMQAYDAVRTCSVAPPSGSRRVAPAATA